MERRIKFEDYREKEGENLLFAFAEGARLKGNAQKVGEELQDLRRRYGGSLTAANVLERAKLETSALHDLFEWDDEAAAHQYRLNQARHIIRHIVVLENGDKTPRRAFIHVEKDSRNVYVDTVDALADDELRLQVLSRARQELESFTRKYSELMELSEVVAVARKTIRRLKEEAGRAG